MREVKAIYSNKCSQGWNFDLRPCLKLKESGGQVALGGIMVSLVVAARNDDHGGNFLYRLQVFINILIPQLSKFHGAFELIIVEWNPPKDKVRLIDAIKWPKELFPNLNLVRIIEVPSEIHSQLPGAERMPMFEYIAKNVGIRRANGDFILATNPDLLLSKELIKFLASQKLTIGRFYRMDRYDFSGGVSIKAGVADALRFAKRNIHLVHVRHEPKRALKVRIGRLRRLYCIITGKWPGSHDTQKTKKRDEFPVFVLKYDNGEYGGVHTNASGDFLLTHAENWEKIKGFPEFTDSYTHLDSYGCHQLKALGLEQVCLVPPCMILHADHSREHEKFRPKLSLNRLLKDIRAIREGLLGPAINGDDWGLGSVDLHEIKL